MRVRFAFLVLLASCLSHPSLAWVRGAPTGATFNGGKVQVNLNFPGIGGDYPFVNLVKNTSGGWSYRDNSGTPAPTELDSNGYPIPGAAMFSLSSPGVIMVIRIPAQAYVGGNCSNGISGICFSALINGKGTFVNPGTPITATALSVTTGLTTTINFSTPQDFRPGMEVPISGTTGVTAINGGGGNLTAGGSAGAWTVCAANLTTTSIQLCLNDQTTPLQTSGTAGGTTTVTYGRNAVGVSARGRIVSVVTGSPVSINIGISAQDATTPITYRNGLDGLAMVLQGPEEVRYEQWRSGTCPGGYNPACQFGAANLSKMRELNAGVIRHLNTINTNESMEVNWADRRPASYVSFGSDIYDRTTSGVPSVYAGTTGSSGNNYTLTFGSGPPVDRQQIVVRFDAVPITVASGANALVAWTNHGLSAAAPFYMVFAYGSGSMPGGTTATTTYYAITSCGGCDADHIQFATSAANALAGIAVTTSSTGSSVFAHATVVATVATFTNGNSSIGWTAHNLSIGDQVSFTGADTLSYPFNTGAAYFVETVPDADHITVSLTPGGAALTPLQSGTFGAVKNPTLNLNGTGAVSIKDRQLSGVGTTRTTYPLARNSGGQLLYASMTYDAVLGVWIKRGGDSSLGTQYFTSGWPPETALQYCVSLGAHCWFQPPQFTIDGPAGITDYNPGLYVMVKTNAPAWMVPRFEILPNEFWNGLFAATSLGKYHAVVYASSAGWSTNSGINQIAGKIASVLGQAVNNAYGNPAIGTGYQTIVGVQTFTFSGTSGAANNAPRLTSANYVAQSLPAQSGYSKSAASNWATHVACAQYFNPGYYGTFVATSLAAANAGGVITGSISGNQLTVTSVRVVTSPVFGVGAMLLQGPGVIPGTTVISGVSSPYTLDRTYSDPVGSTNINYAASGYDPTAVQSFIDSANYNATFNGSISGTTLTATGVVGFITTGGGSGGDRIEGSGVASGTQIVSQLTGATGKDGTYAVSVSQTVGSSAMAAAGVFSIPAESTYYQRIYSFAQSYTNSAGSPLKLNGYEGGYSPDFLSAGLSLTDQLYQGGKVVTSSPGSATGIYGYVLSNLQNFKTAGGEFPSMFTTTGSSPGNDAWSVLNDLYEPAPTPIWNAYRDFNFLLKRDLDPASNDNSPMWLEKAA